MPMGGGTFTVQNKTLPGAYINFVSAGSAATSGERGIVALPLELDWGLENQVFTVEAAAFYQVALKVLGHDATAPELLLVREAVKRCNTLLVYRANSGGTKATATVGGLTVAAKYGGARGDSLKVAIQTNADDESKVDVITYLDEGEVDRQTVAATSGAAALTTNDYVSFSGEGTITAGAATSLAGGTNGTVNGTAHTAALNAFEVENFNVIGYPGTDEAVKALYAAFVKRLRDDEGRKVVGVLHRHSGDSIGLINVKNGVKLADGSVLTGDKAVAWVAGATAAAQINQSLTNTPYDGAVDVDVKYTKGQYEAAIKAGEFVFYAEGGKARVLSDINSLTGFGGMSEDWTSNRLVRVMDGWANDVGRIFGERYLGTQTNSDTGRALFKADLVSLGNQYQGIDAISGFASEDIVVQQGGGKRDVAVDCALKPNDSMEKLYMTVRVN